MSKRRGRENMLYSREYRKAQTLKGRQLQDKAILI